MDRVGDEATNFASQSYKPPPDSRPAQSPPKYAAVMLSRMSLNVYFPRLLSNLGTEYQRQLAVLQMGCHPSHQVL